MVKVGDIIEIYGIRYEVTPYLFLYNKKGVNCEIFDKLNLDKKKVFLEVLGYYNDARFPISNNIEDLNKIIDYLKKVIIKKTNKNVVQIYELW